MPQRTGADRRAIITAAITATLISAGGIAVQAQGAKKPLARKAAAAKPGPHQAIVDAAKRSEQKGEVCRAHCVRLIRSGDKSMQECLKLVNEMLPLSAAMGRLAANDAPRLKDLAKVCRAACTDCQAECKKHADHHAECKASYEACTALLEALKPLLA